MKITHIGTLGVIEEEGAISAEPKVAGTDGAMLVPIWDLGGTHSRVALATVRYADGCPEGWPELDYPGIVRFENPRQEIAGRGMVSSFRDTLECVLDTVEQLVNAHAEAEVLPVLAASLPGAWTAQGRAYPNSLPNLVGVYDVDVNECLRQLMGSEWRYQPNNDGIMHSVAIGQAFLDQYRPDTDKVIVFIPGTGFGGGMLQVSDGHAVPFPGPQQIFDMIVGRDGDTVVTPEDTSTGVALSRLAGANDTLAEQYGDAITGKALSEHIDDSDQVVREFVQGLYRGAGKGMATTMLRLESGTPVGDELPGKTVITDIEMARQFWKDAAGTTTYVISGWVLKQPGRDLVFEGLHAELAAHGRDGDFAVYAADQMAALGPFIQHDATALLGTAMCAASR